MSRETELLDRAPPHDLDAERGVLGAILLDHDKIEGIEIEPRDFHVERHRVIFELLQNYPHPGNVDIAVFKRWATDAGQWDRIGGAAYLAELIQSATVAHVADYAGAIREKAQRRRAISHALDIAQTAYTSNGEWTRELAAGAEALGKLATDVGGGGDEMILSADRLMAEHSRLREPVIHGLAREGETVNIIASSKVGKSWLTYGLAFSVATGSPWLGHDCEPGRVLLIDNELHRETIAHRLDVVRKAMGLGDEALGLIDVLALRGRGKDILSLSHHLRNITPGTYKLIVADAFYRFIPSGTSENDNAAVMGIYNAIDSYTSRLGAVWVNVHHASKGNQADKAVTDVGSGAGSQSRAADAHIVLRPHEDEGTYVMEAAVRSFAPNQAVAIRWNYPLWEIDQVADPARLRQPKRGRQPESLDVVKQEIVNVMVRMARPAWRSEIEQNVTAQRSRFVQAWRELFRDGLIIESGRERMTNNQSYPVYSVCQDDHEN